MVFSRLHYPETVIDNTIKHFIEMRVTENVCSKQQVSDEQDAPTRIVLPLQFNFVDFVVALACSSTSEPVFVSIIYLFLCVG